MSRHLHFLLKTLDIAKRRKGFCAPNPSVGAVVVKDDVILAEGCHWQAGAPHAEHMALSQLEYPLTGATLYVSLEPCCHWGKTPPCIEEIVRSGVSEVIYAFADPNPVVAEFNTKAYLETHGIRCQQIALAEIEEFYQSYHYWTLHKQPFVTVKVAQSFNGKVGVKGIAQYKLTGEALKRFTHQHRLQSDVLLTTAATIEADDPLLNVRLEESSVDKPIAIIDSELSVSLASRVFIADSKRFVFHQSERQPRQAPGKHIEYIAIDKMDEGLDLKQVLATLGAKGYHDVWVEAGGRLLSSLLKQKLVHRLILYIAPCWLPVDAIDSFVGMHAVTSSDYKTIHWQQMGQDMVAIIDF